MCLKILLHDFYSLDETIDKLVNDCSNVNIFSQDEYKDASDLKEALQDKDFDKLGKIVRRPLFSYIEIEVTK